MSYEAIIYEKVEEKIFRITLNRPEKLNAMSRQLLSELDGALDEFENNNDASGLSFAAPDARSVQATICSQ